MITSPPREQSDQEKTQDVERREAILEQLAVIPIPLLYELALILEKGETEARFSNYVMSGVSFKPLERFASKHNLSPQQSDILMKALWSSFLEHSTGTWPMSRDPGKDYVLLDFARNQDQIIAEAYTFFTTIGPEVVNAFAESQDVSLSEFSMTELMAMSVGGQVDASQDSSKACPVNIIKNEIMQQAPSSVETIAGAVAKSMMESFAHYLPDGIPLVIYDKDGEILIGVDKKGTTYTGRGLSEYDLEQHADTLASIEQLRQQLDQQLNEISTSTLEAMLNLKFELPMSVKRAHELLQDKWQTEVTRSNEAEQLSPDAVQMEVDSVGEPMGSIDLSGMSKITQFIERANHAQLSAFAEVEDSDLSEENAEQLRRELLLGMQRFLQLWIESTTEILQEHGCSSYEFGGDGFKALCTEQPLTIEEQIAMTLRCNANWEQLLASARSQDYQDLNQRLFALFVQENIDQGNLDQIMTKTAMYPEIKTTIVNYNNQMYEVQTEAPTETAMTLVKQYFRDHQSDFQYVEPDTGHIRNYPFVILPEQKVRTAIDFAEFSDWDQFYVEDPDSGDEYVIIVDKRVDQQDEVTTRVAA